jgi:hypothetical protein
MHRWSMRIFARKMGTHKQQEISCSQHGAHLEMQTRAEAKLCSRPVEVQMRVRGQLRAGEPRGLRWAATEQIFSQLKSSKDGAVERASEREREREGGLLQERERVPWRAREIS